MNKIWKSKIRRFANSARKHLIRDKKTQKILVVKLNNMKVFLRGGKKPINTVFDYEAILSGPQVFYWDEKYHGNVHFGIADAIKKYIGITGYLDCCIEHGVYFGDYVSEDEAVDSGFSKIVTFGRQRLEHLKNVANVEIVPIGPYIYYANPLLTSEEMEDIHKENGKTLLVFPTHSVDRVDAEFDIDMFVSRVEEFKNIHGFEKVIVCLFYKDLLLGRGVHYLNKGYQVVTAGYRDDPLFLRRLKSFILISDYTISNDVGTHVGYCICLGKPHTIFEQEIKQKPYTQKDNDVVIESENSTVLKEKGEVSKAFCNYHDNITDEQLEVVNKYWGLEYLCEKTELRGRLL